MDGTAGPQDLSPAKNVFAQWSSRVCDAEPNQQQQLRWQKNPIAQTMAKGVLHMARRSQSWIGDLTQTLMTHGSNAGLSGYAGAPLLMLCNTPIDSGLQQQPWI